MRRYGALAAAILAAAPAIAQVAPPVDTGVLQQQQIDEERRRRELERERQMRKPAAEPIKRPEAAPPAPGAGAEAIRFLVREIRFTPSEILKPEELEAIARDFRGRELTLSELQGIAARVNALYKAKGVVTAQAVIPPQDVSEGVVQVRLVEGRVGRIEVKGNETTREGYVTSRLALKPAELIDLDRLERAIVRYNRTNDTQIRAELKPGTEFGTTDLYVTLAEPPRHDLRLTLDNSGSPSTGLWREGLSYANRSLLGYRDELSASYSHSSGHDGKAFGYAVPFNPWGGRISFTYYDDSTAIRHGPLETLHITGTSTAHIVSVRQPLFVQEKMQFDLLVGGKKRTTANWIDTVFLQRTNTEDRNLGGDFQLLGSLGYLFANYSRAWGHAETPDRADYRIDRGNLRYSLDFAGGTTFRASTSWQGSPQRVLPSSEQFFIGGEGTVRGYYIGQFSGDYGYTIGMELQRELGSIGQSLVGGDGVRASGFLFADYGKTYPFRPPGTGLRPYEQLSSVGAGVNLALGPHFYGRATLAYGLTDLPNMPRPYSLLIQFVASAF